MEKVRIKGGLEIEIRGLVFCDRVTLRRVVRGRSEVKKLSQSERVEDKKVGNVERKEEGGKKEKKVGWFRRAYRTGGIGNKTKVEGKKTERE